MLKKVLFGSIVASSLLMAQSEVDVNVNGNTYEIGGNAYLNNFYYLNDNSKYYFGVHFLGTDENDELKQKLIAADIKVMNAFSNEYGLSFGLGMKGVYTDSKKANMLAVGLGAFAKYAYNENLFVDASYHYAPQVLSYMDGDRYREFRSTINYAVVQNGYIYTGARVIKADFKDHVVDFDKSAFVGFRFTF